MTLRRCARGAIVVACITAAAACGGSVEETRFPDAATARAAGALDDGRLPRALPPDATELVVAATGDGTARAGRFRAPPAAAAAFAKDLRVVEPGRVLFSPCAPDVLPWCARPDWWPPALHARSLRATDIAKAGFFLGAAREDGRELVYAVDAARGDVLFWTRAGW